MNREVVALLRFSGVCRGGHEFVAHQRPDFTYGSALARTSEPQEVALVEGLDDPTHTEVAGIVRDLTSAAGKGNWYGYCFQAVYGYACDPAPSGELYSLLQPVRCSVCGTSELVRFGPGDEPVVDQMEVLVVTHERWKALTNAERRQRIEVALAETGCMNWLRTSAG